MMLAKVLKYVCPNLEFPSVKLLISLSETFPKTRQSTCKTRGDCKDIVMSGRTLPRHGLTDIHYQESRPTCASSPHRQ